MSQIVESIEFIDAGELTPWEHIYRNSSSSHRCTDKKLRASIERYGLRVPIVCMRTGDELFILDGVRRWKILLATREPVPVIVLDNLSPEDAVVRSFHADPLCREDPIERMYFVNQLFRFRQGRMTSEEISELLLLTQEQVTSAKSFPLAQLGAQALCKLGKGVPLDNVFLQNY